MPTTEGYNGAYTGQQIDSAIGAVANKQDKLTGVQGQVVGFDESGKAVAQDAPSGLPDGGTPGQMLWQGESGPEWGDKPVMYVNITATPSETSADKSYAQIVAAKEAGYAVFALNTTAIIPLVSIQSNQVVFSVRTYSNERGASLQIAISKNNIVAVSMGLETTNAKDVEFSPASSGLSSTNVQDAIEEVNAKATPKSVSVTLSASGWASNSQTVTVQGVKTSGQSVRISPATKTDADNWVAAGVWCSEPTTANQLVFTCDTAPTENININVELQEVQI